MTGERQLPSNVEAEAALLGALMIDNRLFERVSGVVDGSHFFEPLHGRVFDAIARFTAAGQIATPVTLAPLFVADPAMAELGGPKYLMRLTGSGAGLIGAPQFAKQIRDLAGHRELIEVGYQIADRAWDTATEVNPAARREEAEALLSAVDDGRITPPTAVSFASAISMAIAASKAVAAGGSIGVTIDGLPEWDEVVGGGMPAGDLIYLAGRPSMGKTSLALRVARGAARAGFGVLFISREMKVLPIAMRVLADMLFEAGSPATMDDVKRGRLSPRDLEIAAQIEAENARLPMVFEEVETLNAVRIAPMIRKHQRAMEKVGRTLDLVIVDYLGLLEPPAKRGNREQEVSDISRTLKSAALSTNVAMLALSQLSRAVEQREDKRPMLSDLRDSGSLEQDADGVVFVYRAQYYLERTKPRDGDKRREQWELDMQAERDRLEIIGAKSRQGAIHTRKCYYFDSRQAVRSDDFYRFGGGAA